MRRDLGGFLLAAGMLFAATGCNLVLNRGALENAKIEVLAETALFQTAAVKSTEAPPPTATSTLHPTLTFTPTITLTSTLEKVTITVSRNTNCRTGPDKFFDLVGIMKVGETAEAIARNAEKTYWVIRLPANTAKECWLWWEWAALKGNGEALPVRESPPTPTWSPKPDFTFYFAGLTPCGGSQIMRLQVTNTGNVPWESYRIKIEDTVTAASTNNGFNDFKDYGGCTAGPSSGYIAPGDANSAIGLVPPGSSGHNVEVTLSLYTANSGGGTVMTGNFNMTMP